MAGLIIRANLGSYGYPGNNFSARVDEASVHLFMSGADEHALLERLRGPLDAPAAIATTQQPFRCSELLLLLLHPSEAVRSLAVQLLVQLLHIADAPRAELLSRWAAAWAQGWREPAPPRPMLLDAQPGLDLSSSFGTALGGQLVRTEHSATTLRALELSLSSRLPTLLLGPAGSGKSALLAVLARAAGQDQRMVTVHLDEQVDSRALLGTYVCAERPGEFAWQPGVVTQAVVQGRWLLLEGVDKAPLEVRLAAAARRCATWRKRLSFAISRSQSLFPTDLFPTELPRSPADALPPAFCSRVSAGQHTSRRSSLLDLLSVRSSQALSFRHKRLTSADADVSEARRCGCERIPTVSASAASPQRHPRRSCRASRR